MEGIILSDSDGVPIKSTFTDEQTTYYYTTSASMFIKKCKNVVKDLIEEELNFIRIRTKLNNDSSRRRISIYSRAESFC